MNLELAALHFFQKASVMQRAVLNPAWGIAMSLKIVLFCAFVLMALSIANA
jgi:hypothetical protein